MREHRFLIAAVATSVAALLAVALLNWVIDPHDYFGRNRLGVYVDNDRYAKRRLAARYPHDSLLLGSSMVAAIDPAALVTPHRFFNAAVVSAVPEDMLFFLQEHHGALERVLLGLDLYMFNGSANPFADTPARDPQAINSWFEYLFSASIAQSSVRTIVLHALGRPPILRTNGQREQADRQALDAAFSQPAYEKVLRQLRASVYANFTYETRRVAVLRQIRDLAASRGFRLTVFINPVNPDVLRLVREMGLEAHLSRFRHDVREVFPGAIDLTESRWSRRESFYWTDPWHYRPEVGAQFVNHILNGADERFTPAAAPAALRSN